MHSITHYRGLTYLLATFVTVMSFVLPPPKLKSTSTITLDQQTLGHGHGISPLYVMYNEDEDNNGNTPTFIGGTSYFVAGFVTIWAVGYSVIGYVETTEGMGDLGGYVGAIFLLVLLFTLIGAAVVEVFRADNDITGNDYR